MVSRMEAGAAMERLIARDENWRDAARVLIAYGNTLKIEGTFLAEGNMPRIGGGGSITGYVAGHGDVRIEDQNEGEAKKFSIGVKKDRVGHYRLWKVKEGVLAFHHFWKSTITTQGDDDTKPEECRLFYDTKSLEPICLCLLRERLFETTRWYIGYLIPEAIFGTVPRSARPFWGLLG